MSMTQEERDLLRKDLCARLPYGVKIELTWWVMGEGTYINTTLEPDHIEQLLNDEDGDTEIKPYIFPLSSMTEEQKEELEDMNWSFDDSVINNIVECLGKHRQFVAHFDCFALIDWLNKNYFDYRDLIGRGLAIDCTDLNIY